MLSKRQNHSLFIAVLLHSGLYPLLLLPGQLTVPTMPPLLVLLLPLEVRSSSNYPDTELLCFWKEIATYISTYFIFIHD